MLSESLSKGLPADALLLDEDECQRYGTDWTRTPGKPRAVALPRTTEEVAFILRTCSELKVPVVPSGGRTGLAGGSVAHRGELVLSLERMRRMDAVDKATRKVRVQAGAVTQTVHEHCHPHGLTWPIDLAAKGTSQIGGNLSTNAGGLKVIKYGMARKWVCGLQAVTMQGDVLELNGELEKNNTGYDLVQLLCGSEGTLAVITEATLKLAPLPSKTSTFFFAVSTLERAVSIFESARAAAFDIHACEFFGERSLAQVERHLKRRYPLSKRAEFYLILDIGDGDEALDPWLEKVVAGEWVEDGLVARSAEERKAVWGLREGITESLQSLGVPRKYDLCLPLRSLDSFLGQARQETLTGTYPFELYLFGHLGDSSPHLNLLPNPGVSPEEFQKGWQRFEAKLFQWLKSVGGSISSEHGIGLLKKHWVEFSRSPRELALFREIKRAFDPQGLLNPGKILD